MTFIYETISKSEQETKIIAKNLSQLLKNKDVVLLYGDVGLGKTVFLRALIRELYGKPELEVTSPTFNLVNVYDQMMPHIWHFDLYRIKYEDELYELGWNEALSDNITLVEWAEKLKDHVPENALSIYFTLEGMNRKLSFHGNKNWQERIDF